MKVEIQRQRFLNNPCPPISRKVFDYFWRNLYSFRFQHYVNEIKHLKIVINQACPGTPLHFYVMLNGEHEFHMTSELYDRDEMHWNAISSIPFSDVMIENDSVWGRKSGISYYKDLIKVNTKSTNPITGRMQ